jgi:site-specific DNA-methyltransferase (adenine-specific)
MREWLYSPQYRIHNANAFEWLKSQPANSFHAVCTDPPYGVLEFTEKEISKLRAGRGGVWRLPPTIGGSRRDPLPRFTVLTDSQKLELRRFFHNWGKALFPALVPGAHVCVAGHPILQHLVQAAMTEAGYEVRTAIMRLYFSFRGGDRPKNAEREFPSLCDAQGCLRALDAFPKTNCLQNRRREPSQMESGWTASALG